MQKLVAEFYARKLEKIEHVVRRMGLESRRYYDNPLLFEVNAKKFSKEAGLYYILATRPYQFGYDADENDDPPGSRMFRLEYALERDELFVRTDILVFPTRTSEIRLVEVHISSGDDWHIDEILMGKTHALMHAKAFDWATFWARYTGRRTNPIRNNAKRNAGAHFNAVVKALDMLLTRKHARTWKKKTENRRRTRTAASVLNKRGLPRDVIRAIIKKTM